MAPRLLSRRLCVAAGAAGASIVIASSGLSSFAQESRMDRDRVTSKDGTGIAFDQSGDGPALILVGGALSDRSAWTPLAKHLAPRLTVYSYDRRGRGDSEDTSPYAVGREVEDIDALIDAAGGSGFVHAVFPRLRRAL